MSQGLVVDKVYSNAFTLIYFQKSEGYLNLDSLPSNSTSSW